MDARDNRELALRVRRQCKEFRDFIEFVKFHAEDELVCDEAIDAVQLIEAELIELVNG